MESSKSRLQPVAKELGLTSERFEYKDLSENAEHYISKAKRKDRSCNLHLKIPPHPIRPEARTMDARWICQNRHLRKIAQ